MDALDVLGGGGSACGSSRLLGPAPQRAPLDLDKGKGVVEPSSATGEDGGISCTVEDYKHMVVVKEQVLKDDESVLSVAKSIGSFFYEAGIDPGAIKLHSFQRMIDAVHGSGTSRNKVPTCDELQGWILQQEMKQVLGHVEDVKRSWGRTGCSILLDGWTDPSGRNLLRFLVDCPKGTIFLRSVDASDAVQDAEAFFLLLSEVIDEVGARPECCSGDCSVKQKSKVQINIALLI